MPASSMSGTLRTKLLTYLKVSAAFKFRSSSLSRDYCADTAYGARGRYDFRGSETLCGKALFFNDRQTG